MGDRIRRQVLLLVAVLHSLVSLLLEGCSKHGVRSRLLFVGTQVVEHV